jgi:hypothetical protein
VNHYNLLLPRELAERGLDHNASRLEQILGASLIDHIDELDTLTDEHNDALKRISDFETHVVPDLETQVERLRGTIAALEDAIKAKKKV